MNYIIGISGKAGHGKDSLANFLRDLFHQNNSPLIRNICFADKLKEVTANILDVEYYYVDDQAGKTEEIEHMGGITGREADQIVGTDVARKINPNVWVYHYDQAIRDLLSVKRKCDLVILTPDVRFENEYEYIKNVDCYMNIKPVLIRVFRPGFNIGSGVNHLSERSLDHIDDWDYKLEAENLPMLKMQAERIYKLIIK